MVIVHTRTMEEI